MRVAFHFNADHDMLGCCYGDEIHKVLFRNLMSRRNMTLKSKVFIGDLLFGVFSAAREENTEVEEVTAFTCRIDGQEYENLFQTWLTSVFKEWNTLKASRIISMQDNNIYVVCFDNIDKGSALLLDEALKDFGPYLGAARVAANRHIHWMLYEKSLIPLGRITDRTFSLFYDEDSEGDFFHDSWSGCFDRMDRECLNWRYTIFDKYHDYEHSRRVAEWEQRCGSMLAFMADDIVARLSDAAPDIGDRLWSALTAFEGAETNEQYAQVMTSCRRIFEYVVDKVAPTSDEPTATGHSIKRHQCLNRIYEYARQARISDTDIDMVIASTDHLSSQWKKLNALANKGVHSEVFREEARRCFVRTILLLDDILSFRRDPFAIHTEIREDIP